MKSPPGFTGCPRPIFETMSVSLTQFKHKPKR